MGFLAFSFAVPSVFLRTVHKFFSFLFHFLVVASNDFIILVRIRDPWFLDQPSHGFAVARWTLTFVFVRSSGRRGHADRFLVASSRDRDLSVALSRNRDLFLWTYRISVQYDDQWQLNNSSLVFCFFVHEHSNRRLRATNSVHEHANRGFHATNL